MAELTTLARPYAKASFEFALAAKDLTTWAKALGVAASVAQDSTVKAVLSSPGLTAKQKAALFIDLCGEDLNESQKNFIQVLAENGRIPLLPEVSSLFALFKANHEKTVEVEVLSAYELDQAVQNKLAQTLSKKLDREVSLQAAIDSSLLGGAVIRAGDTVIDLSVKGRLAKLAEAMSH